MAFGADGRAGSAMGRVVGEIDAGVVAVGEAIGAAADAGTAKRMVARTDVFARAAVGRIVLEIEAGVAADAKAGGTFAGSRPADLAHGGAGDSADAAVGEVATEVAAPVVASGLAGATRAAVRTGRPAGGATETATASAEVLPFGTRRPCRPVACPGKGSAESYREPDQASTGCDGRCETASEIVESMIVHVTPCRPTRHQDRSS